MRKLLYVLLAAGVIVGGYYGYRLLPLFTTSNDDGEKVVLLHGLGRSEMAMLLLESALTEAGFDVHNFGYPSEQQPPEELLQVVHEHVQRCCEDSPQTVHFVGHSLGGLLIRAFLAEQRPQRLGRVVLLGTPNKGSELADAKVHQSLSNAVLDMAGPAARALQTGPDGFPASLPPPDFPVGIIAGTRDNPVTNEWLPLPNDGMVTLDSARLEGMTDFVEFDVTHWGLRNEPDVAAQVVEFLRHGRFESAAGDEQASTAR